jgi:hypothetical protein
LTAFRTWCAISGHPNLSRIAAALSSQSLYPPPAALYFLATSCALRADH